jgi:hypothetical protein
MIAALLANAQVVASSAPSVVRYAMVQPGDIAIVAIVFGTVGSIAFPIVRAWARRLEGKTSAALPLAGIEERLERIERAVEAMSIEVERISEGQRFVTKLLAEKAPMQLPPHNP